MYTLSVSALNEQIKGLLETSFERVMVEGELSRITFHNSGHIYFTLKDKDSAISAVMFRGNASKLKFRLEEGMKVVIDGAITLYKPRGSYQINCFSIEPSGQGALALAYEQLKQKLASQGYFLQERKKTLPKFPNKIALITSATGAALQDMLRVAHKRYRLLEIDIYDVIVQGEGSSCAITEALNFADTQGYDLMILARGGGSIEDLWAFNEENVAEAIFHAKTPVVSAIGHEIDWLISDFVADLRAPTPSAAMEMILPDTNELYLLIDSLTTQLNHNMNAKVSLSQQAISSLQSRYKQYSLENTLEQKKQEIQKLRESFNHIINIKVQNAQRELFYVQSRYPQTIQSFFSLAQNQLSHLKNMLESKHPKLQLKYGFAQISQENHLVAPAALRVGDIFEVQTDKVVITAQVIEKRKM